MTVIRQLRNHFDASKLRPTVVERQRRIVLQTYQPVPSSESAIRHQPDRRCGRDRRQQQRPVLINLRSPHARRTERRRQSESSEAIIGIDVYA